MRQGLTLAAVVALGALLAAAGCGGSGGGGAGGHDAAADTGTPPDTGAADVPAGAVDCTASCARIAEICEGMSTIDENWLSICRQNCGVRLAVMPETALAEVTCVAAATDCATAILCSVSPTGGG